MTEGRPRLIPLQGGLQSIVSRQHIPPCGNEETRRALDLEYDRARRQGVRAGHGHVVAPRTKIVLPDGSTRTTGQPISAADLESKQATEPAWRRFRDLLERGQVIECYSCASDYDDGPPEPEAA